VDKNEADKLLRIAEVARVHKAQFVSLPRTALRDGFEEIERAILDAIQGDSPDEEEDDETAKWIADGRCEFCGGHH